MIDENVQPDSGREDADPEVAKELEGVPEELVESEVPEGGLSSIGGEIGELREELEAAKQDVLYARAETQNIRRRLEKEIADAHAYAATGFARDILSVADNLTRALDAVPQELREDEKVKGFIAGIEALQPERDHAYCRDGPAARSEPASGDDGSADQRSRTRHDRAGNAGWLYDQGSPVEARHGRRGKEAGISLTYPPKLLSRIAFS